MKQITKERILSALDKASKYADKPEAKVVMALATIGLTSACHEAFGDTRSPIRDKDRLELVYHGFSDPSVVFARLSRIAPGQTFTSEEALRKVWLDAYFKTVEKCWERRAKILKFQAKAQISGLETETLDFRGKKLICHTTAEDLELLDSDRVILYNERVAIAKFFVDCVQSYGITIYRRRKASSIFEDGWDEVTGEDVINCAIGNRWSNCWSHERDGEFHLSAGRGECMDSDTDAAWFCAKTGSETPSL